MNKNNIIGLILVTLGLNSILDNLNIMHVDVTLLIVGLIFIVAYYLSNRKIVEKKVGFLITGGILLAINFNQLINESFNGGYIEEIFFFFLIGTVFLLVYIIHYRHLKIKQRWSLVVSIILYALACFIVIIEVFGFKIGGIITGNIWGITLVLVGIYMFKRNNKEEILKENNENYKE
ncbi:MAG: hypothetical protein ACOCRX_00615 [Candidatus Woesearchaeota archaeon]